MGTDLGDHKPQFDVAMVTSAHRLNDSRMYNQEACSLREQGLDVVIIGPHDSPPPEFETRSFIRPKTLVGRALNAFRLMGLIRKTPARIFHCHELDATFAAVLLKPFHRGCVVFDSHELYREMISLRFPRPLRKLVKGLVFLFELGLYRCCDALITVTDGVAEQLAKAAAAAKITVVYNASSPKLFKPLPCALPDTGRRRIMHLGNLTFLRGARQICAAMKIVRERFPDAVLYLIGKMDGQSEAYIQQYRSEQNMTEAIVPVGFVPYAELGAYIPYGELGIMGLQPNQNTINALPVKMFDYMTFGLPTVASDFDEIKRLNAKYEVAVLVDTRDPEAIADGMSRLLENADLRNRLSENARRAVAEEYSWDHMEKRLAALYSRLLGRPIQP